MASYIPVGARRRRHVAALQAMAAQHGETPPEGWLALEFEDARREKITIRLPVWVTAWFRRQGPGYQARLAEVLAVYVSGKLAGSAGAMAELREDIRVADAYRAKMTRFWARIDAERAERDGGTTD